MSTFRIETLGCKVNQCDSRRLAECLLELGLREASETETPDICVVNTCTVTHRADRKGRQLIRQFHRENPSTRLFVTGCYARDNPEDLDELPGVEGVFSPDQWDELFNALSSKRPGGSGGRASHFGHASFPRRDRAFLKIQDGCDFYCNYCIVPHVRGEPRSRDPRNARKEARRLIEAGAREIVLTGIHLGLYGRDLKAEVDLARIVRSLADLDGLGRLRLSSVEALEVNDRLLDAMAHPAVCPHLHLPLQSGDDSVLKAMGRRYTGSEFATRVETARRHLDRPAITTDVMVGFPGETDRQFENTLSACRDLAFSRLHVFRYSPRQGTPAATMPDRVHSRVAKDRSRRLRKLGQRMATKWAESFVNRTVRVLAEREMVDGLLTGYTDRYVETNFPGEPDWIGQLVEVRGEQTEGTRLVAGDASLL